MRCPVCGIDNDRVIDSRASDDGYAIRRRRECLECRRRYTTYERLEELEIKVIKKDGVREPFDAKKLRMGISKACWKRPISEDQIDQVVSGIQVELQAKFEKEIPSSQLGEMIMQQLREIDHVAYIRFASVYREFADLQDFVEEVQPMLANPVTSASRQWPVKEP
jgi:transcriptional repressor NrdR